MADPFDPYRVLGLPVGASRREIRRRYRRLLRQHHPDVAGDPQRAHEIAAELGRAYRMLMDDAQRWRLEQEYYSHLDPELEVVVQQADPARNPVPRLLARARELLQQGDLDGVQLVCSEILAYDPDSAEAYDLLADVYERQRRWELAREMRQTAERLKGLGTAPFRQASVPGPSTEAAPGPRRPARTIWVPEPVAVRWSVVVGTAIVVGALVLWARVSGGEMWALVGISAPVLARILAAAVVLGAGLAASGLVATFDQELGMDVRGGGHPNPLWLFVGASVLVFAPLGAVVHLITALFSDRLSSTFAIFWGGMAGLCLTALAFTEATTRFLWLGANLVCLGGLVGWAIGSMISPREWWR